MSVDDYRQRELSHIERMVVELERLVQAGGIIAERNAVVRPEYWRKRIDTLVNSSAASGSTTKRAAVLLESLSTLSEVLIRHERLDQIKWDQSRRTCGHKVHPAQFPLQTAEWARRYKLEPSIKTVRCRLQALTLEQRIRTRADELWREGGSLEGCADEYWRQARRLIELEVANESAVNETPRCLTLP